MPKFKTNGITLYYEVSGEDDAPAMVWHGHGHKTYTSRDKSHANGVYQQYAGHENGFLVNTGEACPGKKQAGY